MAKKVTATAETVQKRFQLNPMKAHKSEIERIINELINLINYQ
jgi:molecular chaperone GrpE (heat shock protein)